MGLFSKLATPDKDRSSAWKARNFIRNAFSPKKPVFEPVLVTDSVAVAPASKGSQLQNALSSDECQSIVGNAADDQSADSKTGSKNDSEVLDAGVISDAHSVRDFEDKTLEIAHGIVDLKVENDSQPQILSEALEQNDHDIADPKEPSLQIRQEIVDLTPTSRNTAENEIKIPIDATQSEASGGESLPLAVVCDEEVEVVATPINDDLEEVKEEEQSNAGVVSEAQIEPKAERETEPFDEAKVEDVQVMESENEEDIDEDEYSRKENPPSGTVPVRRRSNKHWRHQRRVMKAKGGTMFTKRLR